MMNLETHREEVIYVLNRKHPKFEVHIFPKEGMEYISSWYILQGDKRQFRIAGVT